MSDAQDRREEYDYLNNTTADMRLIGFPNHIGSFGHFDSSPRVNMLNHHLPQSMVMKQSEFNKIFSGTEEKFIEYTFDHSRRKFDCEIIEIIPKYQAGFLNGGIDVCPTIYVIVKTLDPNGPSQLDYFKIDRYFMGTNDFGWIPTLNKGRLQKGDILPKEAVITHSPAVKDDLYCYGLNLNTVYGSFPETIEDAFIISESAAARMTTTQVSKRVINCRRDRRPLNLYGKGNENKFLPDIGSVVRDDGALCAFRPVHGTTCIADIDPHALRNPLVLQDEIIYAEAGATIVDLDFHFDRKKNNGLYEQAEKYINNNSKCWEGIYLTYLQYRDTLTLTQEMDTLVTEAIWAMIAQGVSSPSLSREFGNVMRNFNIEGESGQVVDFLQAVVTYTIPRKVSNGTKISDLHGSKQ